MLFTPVVITLHIFLFNQIPLRHTIIHRETISFISYSTFIYKWLDVIYWKKKKKMRHDRWKKRNISCLYYISMKKKFAKQSKCQLRLFSVCALFKCKSIIYHFFHQHQSKSIYCKFFLLFSIYCWALIRMWVCKECGIG